MCRGFVRQRAFLEPIGVSRKLNVGQANATEKKLVCLLRCWRGVAHRAIEGTHVVLVNTVAAGAVAASELAIFINCRTAREEDRPVLVFFWHHVKRSAEVAARVKRVEAEHGLERRGRLWGTDVVASLRVD